jgi:hypothetical protein
MAAQAVPPPVVTPLVFEGDGMWQMKQDLAAKTKAALRALKYYNTIMINPASAKPEERAKIQDAVINSQRALTEARTYWILAGLAEREMWNKETASGDLVEKKMWDEETPAPTFWQVLQEGQKLLNEYKSAANLYKASRERCEKSNVHENNKGPGLCNSKQPLGKGLPPGKFLITHECTDKEYVKAMHLELKSEIIHLDINDDAGVKNVTSVLSARYKKHIAKVVELQKKRLAQKEGKLGAEADKIINENPGIKSLRQVADVLDTVSKRTDGSKVKEYWIKKDQPEGVLKLQHLEMRPTNLKNLEKSRLHLVYHVGLKYLDADEEGAYTFRLVSSCLERPPPSVPFTENEDTIEFFNHSLSPRLARIIKITIQTKDASAYEITIQPFHGMNTSVVCPFLAKSLNDKKIDMSDFTKRTYKVYQVQPYAIQGKSGFLEAIGQLLRSTQIPDLYKKLNEIEPEAENSLINGKPLFPTSRVFYSASNGVAGGGSVLFICFSGQILGVLTFSPSIRHLWTDNVNPVKPPPLVAFRGRPRMGMKQSQHTASIFSKKAMADDEAKKKKIPKHITLSHLPDGGEMRQVDFWMNNEQQLIFKSAPEIKPELILRPEIFDHSSGKRIVSWELCVQATQHVTQMIGYKFHQKNDAGNVLIEGANSEWKFEKDIKGASLAAKKVLKIGVVISETDGYFELPSEIKMTRVDIKTNSVEISYTEGESFFASFYNRNYIIENNIPSNSIPKKIKIGGLPEVTFGDSVTELAFSIQNNDKFVYVTDWFGTGLPHVELRPVVDKNNRIMWELILVDKATGPYAMAQKQTFKGTQDSSELFQTGPNLWEFYYDVHGGQFRTMQTREIFLTIDESAGYNQQPNITIRFDDLIHTDTVKKRPQPEIVAPDPSDDVENLPWSPTFAPQYEGGSSRPMSPFQASRDGRSSRVSSRDTSPARRVNEDHTVSVLVPRSQATDPELRSEGGLFTDRIREDIRVAPNNIPNSIVVSYLPGGGRRPADKIFKLFDPNKLLYRTEERGAGVKNLSMHVRTRPIASASASNVEWEIYIIDGNREIPIGRKANTISQASNMLFTAGRQKWLFTKSIDGIQLSEKNAFATEERNLEIVINSDAGFTIASTNLSAQPMYAPAAILPLQPRRLSSKPAPAPWASPAVDMETLMASIDDIKRALNEVHLSARPRG